MTVFMNFVFQRMFLINVLKASVQKKIIDQNSCVQNWNLHGIFPCGIYYMEFRLFIFA